MRNSLDTPLFSAFMSSDGPVRLHGGKWHPGPPDRALPVRAPADGRLLGFLHRSERKEADVAIQAARAAQPDWAARPLHERVAVLHHAADLLERHAVALAALLSQEISKSRAESLGEVMRSVHMIRFTAQEAQRLQGEALWGDAFPGFAASKVAVTRQVPLGVVLAISPFNFPVNLTVSKIVPALATGNAVVLKPPTQGGLSALALVSLFVDAGVPSDVLQVVTGPGAEIGDYLVEHPSINMITFTGSTTVGSRLAKKAGMIPVVLELGGKDAAIVLADADLERAVNQIVDGAFRYSGQRCTAVKRVLVTEPIAEAFVERLVEQVEALPVGPPESDAVITPMISTAAADYVQELIDDAVANGAKLRTGNRRDGSLMWPTVVDHVTDQMRLAWEEQFGPALPVLRTAGVEEAVALANRSSYGLQSCLFTQDVDSAFQLAERLEVGTVQINGKTTRGPDHFPFLGTKGSGLGVQGIRYSLESMTRLRVVVVDLAR